jgi:Txe/YoeB family toxin of Txe-Axe toxin-antitoxin module
MKAHSVAFISGKLKEEFNTLKEGRFQDKQLYSYINRAMDDLVKDPLSGTKIPKKLWPKDYIKHYKITNLWKYDLPNGWRLIYTTESNEVMIVSIILEWFDHKGYERRFGY